MILRRSLNARIRIQKWSRRWKRNSQQKEGKTIEVLCALHRQRIHRNKWNETVALGRLLLYAEASAERQPLLQSSSPLIKTAQWPILISPNSRHHSERIHTRALWRTQAPLNIRIGTQPMAGKSGQKTVRIGALVRRGNCFNSMLKGSNCRRRRKNGWSRRTRYSEHMKWPSRSRSTGWSKTGRNGWNRMTITASKHWINWDQNLALKKNNGIRRCKIKQIKNNKSSSKTCRSSAIRF